MHETIKRHNILCCRHCHPIQYKILPPVRKLLAIFTKRRSLSRSLPLPLMSSTTASPQDRRDNDTTRTFTNSLPLEEDVQEVLYAAMTGETLT